MTVAGYVWLGIIVVSILVEFFTLELVSIWVSLGSLVALIMDLCGVSIEWQIIVAVVVSVVCILGLRRFCVKFLLKGKEKTNMDLLINCKVKLIKAISQEQEGMVKHNGIEWTARSEKGESIKEGSLVEIIGVQGNKLIVKKVKQDKTIKREVNMEEEK